MRKHENTGKILGKIRAGAGIWLCLGLGLVQPVPAAVTNLRITSATSTQIAVSFTITAPGSACTIEISEESDYTPLMPDVDPTLYSGADQCNRASSVVHGNNYTVVLGKRGAEAIDAALDGYTRSRALYADAAYYIRVTNGSAAEITARTPNIMLGTTTGERIATLAPFRYKRVDTNKLINPMFADPYTGARIINPPETLGYAYANTSALAWSGVSGCQIAIAGSPNIKGSCRFTDATGSNWGFTSTSLTAAIQADDDNYATYSGTAQEKLFVRYGTGRFSNHGTYGAPGGSVPLASQNLAFRALTSDATGDGGYLKVCYTFDGSTCASPERRITLTTSEASYLTCHDSPCTIPDNPGDTAVFDREETTPGQARIYNVSGTFTTIRFAGVNATAGCNELNVGEKILAFNSNVMSDVSTLTVTAKDCGASPPQFTSSESLDLTNNSTNGGTYWRYTGFSSKNWNFGILLWKESTTSGSTISIDVPLWRTTWGTYWRYNSGAGGFGRNCSNVATSDGYYTCMGGYEGNVIYGVKPSGKGLAFKNYGFATWRGDQLSGNLSGSGQWASFSAAPQTSNTNYAPWSDTQAGVFYVRMGWASGVMANKPVLVKVTLDLTTKAVTDPDSSTDLIFNSPRGPKAGISSVQIITPCLNTCSAAEDDVSITKMKTDFSAEWAAQASRFPDCRIDAVQGSDIYEVCTNGGQDTYAWVFVYDIGNGLPVGSGYVGNHGNTLPIYAAVALHDTPECRWCPLHTFQSPAQAGGAAFSVLESSGYKCFMQVTGSALSSCSVNGTGTCSACPDVTLNGVSYLGKNWCSDITLTSSDPVGVAEWESGDPVNALNCAATVKWIQKLEVGDFIRSGSEFIRLIERTSNTQWKAIRGWGYYWDNSIYGPTAHNNGDTWYTHYGAISKDPLVSDPNTTNALYWYPALSTDGQNTDYSFLGRGQNHGLNALDAVVAVEAAYSATPVDFATPSSVKAAFTTQLYTIMPKTFGGKLAFCQGNACEKHPSRSQILASAQQKKPFADIHPIMFLGTNSTNEQPLVAGKSYIREYNDVASIDPKHHDVTAFTGPFGLHRVDTLTDSADDSGKFCVSIVNDDCFSGSTAGKKYMVNDRMDPAYTNGSQYTCRQVQFASLWGDACMGNYNPAAASLSQYEVPVTGSFGNGSRARVLSRVWRYYRGSATENTKAMPDGTAFLNRAHWAVMNLPWPGPDTRNRATFNPLLITVPSTTPPGTDNVLVQFGRNTSFQCSNNRDNTCYAESATINEAVPFKFDHETLTGVSCASGCTVALPLIPGRMTYYRIVYRNSGGTVIHRGPTKIVGVN